VNFIAYGVEAIAYLALLGSSGAFVCVVWLSRGSLAGFVGLGSLLGIALVTVAVWRARALHVTTRAATEESPVEVDLAPDDTSGWREDLVRLDEASEKSRREEWGQRLKRVLAAEPDLSLTSFEGYYRVTHRDGTEFFIRHDCVGGIDTELLRESTKKEILGVV